MIEETIRQIIREEIEQALDRKLSGFATPSNNDMEFLTTEEAAGIAKVKPATIRDWIRKGALSRNLAGGSLRVDRAELIDRMRNGFDIEEESADDEAVREAMRILGGAA